MDTRSKFGWSDGPGATWDKTNTELNWIKEISGSDTSYTGDRDSGDDDNNNWYEDGEDNPSSDEDDEQSFMN